MAKGRLAEPAARPGRGNSRRQPGPLRRRAPWSRRSRAGLLTEGSSAGSAPSPRAAREWRRAVRHRPSQWRDRRGFAPLSLLSRRRAGTRERSSNEADSTPSICPDARELRGREGSRPGFRDPAGTGAGPISLSLWLEIELVPERVFGVLEARVKGVRSREQLSGTSQPIAAQSVRDPSRAQPGAAGRRPPK